MTVEEAIEIWKKQKAPISKEIWKNLYISTKNKKRRESNGGKTRRRATESGNRPNDL